LKNQFDRKSELPKSMNDISLNEIQKLKLQEQLRMFELSKALDIKMTNQLELDWRNGRRRKPSHKPIKNSDVPLFVTLVYLRTELSHVRIAIIFGIARNTVAEYIATTLKSLHRLFKLVEKLDEEKLVLDTTAIKLQKQFSYLPQRLTWSEYYHGNVGKFLIVTTLTGKVVYCSQLYAGSTTDDDIVVTDLLHQVKPGAIYLADKVRKNIKKSPNKIFSFPFIGILPFVIFNIGFYL